MDAYVYLYPLVIMDITRKQSTNIEPGKALGKGPMNEFTSVPAYPSADFKGVVRVNFDTLYSIAWLDLTKEPMIVSAAIICCRCSTCGRTCLPRPVGELPERRRETSWLRRRAGGPICMTGSSTSSGYPRIPSALKLPRLTSGSSAERSA